MNDPDAEHRTFKALASPTRRRILDLVKAEPGCSLNDICSHFAISRIGVMKHLGVLAEADLILSRKEGRVRRHYLNPVPIQQIYERWTTEFSGFWAGQLTQFKQRLEAGQTAANKETVQ